MLSHAVGPQMRTVVDQDFDAEEFYHEHKGKAIHGIVERVTPLPAGTNCDSYMHAMPQCALTHVLPSASTRVHAM